MAWAAIAPAVISGVASLVGGERANRSRQNMADNAHQREVEDLRKAGLNPILSGTGGAGSAVAQVEDAIGPAVNSALTQRVVAQELANMRSQQRLLNTQELKASWEADIAQTMATAQRNSAHALAQEQLRAIGLDNEARAADLRGRINTAEFEDKRLGDVFKGSFKDWQLGDIRRMLEAVLGAGNSARSLIR